MVGLNHPSLADTLNRSLRALLTASGINPDADIGAGVAKGVHTHTAADVTSGTFPGNYLVAGTMALQKGLSVNADTPNYPRTTNLTLTTAFCFVAFDCTGGAKTVTLPAASTSPDGQIFIVKKIDASANNLTLDATGLGQIDGVNTKSVNTQYARIMVICAGLHWQQLI